MRNFEITCGLLVLLSGSGLPAAEPVRLPREQLLVARNPSGVPLHVTTFADWQHRRDEILRGFQTVAGRLPGNEKRCSLDVRIDETVDCGTYIRQRITYVSEPGSRVPAYLCLPRAAVRPGGTPAPAVLCLHPTDNVVGNKVVVGLGGKANRHYAQELAERGFVTLSPAYPLLADYQPDLKSLGWESGTLKAVWDNLRGLDLLDAHPAVQHGRYGAIGHSLGGHNAVYTAVCDDRIVCVVSSCGLDSYLDYMGGDPKRWQPEQGWCQTRYLPKLAGYAGRLEAIPFDFHELVGALAPRDVLIIAPTRDSNFRAESVDRIAAAARPIFALAGVADRLTILHPEADHDFPEAARHAAYDRLTSVLQR